MNAKHEWRVSHLAGPKRRRSSRPAPARSASSCPRRLNNAVKPLTPFSPLPGAGSVQPWQATLARAKLTRMPKDQDYVLDICDSVLGRTACRQQRFEFLRGLPSLKTGRRTPLPVDGFYPDLKLVIEYHEKQHTQSVAFWNKMTACGLRRDEQRRYYDQLRRQELPRNGIRLLEIDYRSFDHRKNGKLRRVDLDRGAVRSLLSDIVAV